MNDNKFDFSGHVKTIEDAQTVETLNVEKPLTDEDLENNGLIKTTAFVRTKKSKNALRVKKNKEKKAANGIKQLNIEVHEDNKEIIKTVNSLINKNGIKAKIIKFIIKHF